MSIEAILLTVAVFSAVIGVAAVRARSAMNQRREVRNRLDQVFGKTASEEQRRPLFRPRRLVSGNPLFAGFSSLGEKLRCYAQLAGLAEHEDLMLQVSLVLLFAPIIIVIGLGLEIIFGVLAGAALCLVPLAGVLIRASQVRSKFTTQLPDAIDLIVSVLRSGHSIPRAIQTVAEEIPQPCGGEFKEVLQRMNLGQPLSQALNRSCEKYLSHELDLIRRAVAIQAEVGGSLAELLDKTNYTLRQRIRLQRHVKVLTSQSRLTAFIVGLLPLVMAVALHFLNPGYLAPLFDKDIGRALLIIALALQLTGILVMRKLSTIKV